MAGDSGIIILAAAAVGTVAGGMIGPLDISLTEFGIAALLAFGGSVARQGLDAKAAYEEAVKNGKPPPPLLNPVLLGYSLLGAPFMGAVALAGVRWVGFVPDYGAVPAIMALGYGGRDILNGILSMAKSIVLSKLEGPKP